MQATKKFYHREETKLLVKKTISHTAYLYAMSSMALTAWMCLTLRNRWDTVKVENVSFLKWDLSFILMVYVWLIFHTLYISLKTLTTVKNNENTLLLSLTNIEKVILINKCLRTSIFTALAVPLLFYIEHDNVLMWIASGVSGFAVVKNFIAIYEYYN